MQLRHTKILTANNNSPFSSSPDIGTDRINSVGIFIALMQRARGVTKGFLGKHHAAALWHAAVGWGAAWQLTEAGGCVAKCTRAIDCREASFKCIFN